MDNLKQIIALMERDPAPGVVLIDDERPIPDLAQRLERLGFFRSHSWRGVINCLNLDLPTFVVIPGQVPRELAELLKQYSEKNGKVQIFDFESNRMCNAQFNPRVAKILLIAKHEDLRIVEETLQH